MTFKRWKPTRQLPPLGELVLLYRAEDGYRKFHRFVDDGMRIRVITEFRYSHWREEMTVDSP